MNTREDSQAIFNRAANLTISDREFEQLRRLIHQEAGISLSEQKRQLLVSRLAKRLRYHNFGNFTQYYIYLTTQDSDRTELLQAINCVTTNTTSFFREKHHFDFLQERLLRKLQERAQQGGERKLRIWSAACSSGEEPYSIAMTVLESFLHPAQWDIRLLASDIDTKILERAMEGQYSLGSDDVSGNLGNLTPAMRKKYFTNERGEAGSMVRVRPEVKKLITFRRINFVDPVWPIRTEFDAVFCRNVIIYFDRETQARLFERIHGLMKDDGFLFVGHSESLHWLPHFFTPVSNTIYRKVGKGGAR